MYAQKVKVQIDNKSSTSNLPMGWIKLEKKIKQTITEEDEITQEEFEKNVNEKMDEIVNRFIEYKKTELRYENFTENEIEDIVREYLTYHDNYDEYPDENSYDSENDDSVYEYSDDDELF